MQLLITNKLIDIGNTMHYLIRHIEHQQAAAVAGASNDEIHVVVEDEDGLFTGTKDTVLESFGFVSLASDAKDSVGNSNYYRDVIEAQSEYIYWSGHSTAMLSSAKNKGHSQQQLVLHSVDLHFQRIHHYQVVHMEDNPTVAQKSDAWTKHFGDAELIDLSFLIVGSTSTDAGGGSESAQDTLADHNSLVNNAIQLAELRKDCLVVASPRRTSCVGVSSEATQSSNVIADFANVTSSSYAVLDSGWVYQYERYNDKYCWIPGNGHTAGIMARSDLLQDPWYLTSRIL